MFQSYSSLMGLLKRTAKGTFYTAKKAGRAYARDVRRDVREMSNLTYEHSGCDVRHRSAEAMMKCADRKTGITRRETPQVFAVEQPATNSHPFTFRPGIWPNSAWSSFQLAQWEGGLIKNRSLWTPSDVEFSLRTWWSAKSGDIAREAIGLMPLSTKPQSLTLSTRQAFLRRKEPTAFIRFTFLSESALTLEVQGDYRGWGIERGTEYEEGVIWRKLLKLGMVKPADDGSTFSLTAQIESRPAAQQVASSVVKAFKTTLIPSGPIYANWSESIA